MTHKLGEGTFSEVLKVKNKNTGKIFAMKRFRKRFNSTYEEIQNLREIQALRRLNPHPHVIQLLEVIFDQKHGVLALNFELMESNLYELICKKTTIMTEAKAKNYFFQICKGMDYMHSKGIFHRDIKPENILIKENTIKLADFGSCRGIHSKQPYTEYIATRWYRSPECLLCDGIYNFKMDIWGAGCVLYEIITKAPLFPGSNELDQLHRIHSVLGTPSVKLLTKILGSKGISPEYNFTPREGTGLKALLPKVSPECLDLLTSLLIYDPEFRLTSREALKHNFFKEYYEQEQTSDKPRSSRVREEPKPAPAKEIPQVSTLRKSVKTPEKIALKGGYDKRHPILLPTGHHFNTEKGDHHDNSDAYSVVSTNSTSNVSTGKGNYNHNAPRKRLSKSKLSITSSQNKVILANQLQSIIAVKDEKTNLPLLIDNAKQTQRKRDSKAKEYVALPALPASEKKSEHVALGMNIKQPTTLPSINHAQ